MKRRRIKSLDQEENEERIKRKKRESPSDPWAVPRSLEKKTELCERLYEALRGFRDSEKRFLCEFLIRIPSRRAVPEYYRIIQNPIDLLRIQYKMKADSYSTVSQFLSDVRLVINNAREYYMPPSDEHKRAVALEREFLRTLRLYIEVEEPLSPTSPKTVSLKLSNLPSNMQATPSSSKSTPAQSSSKSVGGVKATRSKAWLEEYCNSDNPVKVFFSSIYSHHDPAGEYIAQPFLEMPSRKDYPEYYKVIVEPIDLATIKSSIESGRYQNLKEVQDDLLLMIKNAHHFNEPGSAIYKMATTLRRFIINRCLELERKHKTVKIAQKVKSPPPGGGDGSKGQRQQKQSLTDTADESESGDELTATESEGEEEGEGSGRQRLLLQIKKEKLFGKDQDPLEKVLKSKTRPGLKKLLLAIYRTLVRVESPDDKLISELFMRLPSTKLYPEYYIVINKPIDFREISRKIKDEQYKTLDDFMSDVELLVNNACTFNEENSQIHTDALLLQKIALSAHDQIKRRWGASILPVTMGTDKSDDKLSMADSIKVLYLSVINATDMTGRNLWHTVRDALPISETSDSTPGHHHSAATKRCVGMATISHKIEKGEYLALDSLFSDLSGLFDSYCEHHLPNTQPYKDAVMLHRISVTKYNDLSKEERRLFKYPNVQEAVGKILIEIMRRTMEYKDDSGCVLSEALQGVVVTQESSTKEDAKSRRVFSLNKLYSWVSIGRYTRLDQLQADVLSVLNNAQEEEEAEEHRRDRGVAKLARALEKAYVIIRDEVCSQGTVLWSPALKQRTLAEIEKEEENLKMEMEEAKKKQRKRQQRHQPEEEKDMDTGEQHVLDSILPPEKRHYSDKLTVKGVVYEPGEYVYLPPRESHLPPQVSLIESVWTDDAGNEWFDSCWFPRPHETYHIASRKFYQNEIFKSDFYCSYKLSQVVGKCCVLFIKDYIKYRPEGFIDADVFVCESRYFLKQKAMKKIKSWNIFYKYQPVLRPRHTPCSLNKVPSVFVASGGEESMGSSKSDRGSMEPVLEPVLEQESVSEQIQSELGNIHEESFDSSRKVVSESQQDEEDVMEMSFFEDLKEVSASVPNPEENHSYFEQFCIDDKVFKLGDYICVKSDQQQPFIARIDRMWTDADNDPWFHGPWFVRIEETDHLPTRMFYEKELFTSNIQDTNPMRSIIRKCAVLFPNDYVRLRPTEVLEDDVFVCECKYNEVDKSLRRQKSLKHFQLKEDVLLNEVYYLPEELRLWKCHSPKLISNPSLPNATSTPNPKASQQQHPPVVSTSATPTPIQATPPVITVPMASGQLTLTLPQLQALITSQLTNTKGPSPAAVPPQIIQAPPPNIPAVVSTPSIGMQATILAYPCIWRSCKEIFEDNVDLGAHILRSSHIFCEEDGYYCHWKGCPRTKEHNGKPFDALQKITRHVKEVHMLRIVAQKVLVDQLGTNYHRRGTFLKESTLQTETTPLQQFAQQPALLNPPQPLLPITQPIVSFDIASVTPTPVTTVTSQVLGISQLSNATPISSVQNVANSSTPSAPPPNQQVDGNKMETTPPSVFIPPPKNTRAVVHSQIYLDYIKRLRRNDSTLSPLYHQPVRNTPLVPPAKPSQWIDESTLPEGTSSIEALYHLRDHLMTDALKITRFLKSVNDK